MKRPAVCTVLAIYSYTRRLANARKVSKLSRDHYTLSWPFAICILFVLFWLLLLFPLVRLFAPPFVLRRPTRAYQTREPNHWKPVIYVFFLMPYDFRVFVFLFLYRASLILVKRRVYGGVLRCLRFYVSLDVGPSACASRLWIGTCAYRADGDLQLYQRCVHVCVNAHSIWFFRACIARPFVDIHS